MTIWSRLGPRFLQPDASDGCSLRAAPRAGIILARWHNCCATGQLGLVWTEFECTLTKLKRAEMFLGFVRIVRTATQLQVLRCRRTAISERDEMVEL